MCVSVWVCVQMRLRTASQMGGVHRARALQVCGSFTGAAAAEGAHDFVPCAPILLLCLLQELRTFCHAHAAAHSGSEHVQVGGGRRGLCASLLLLQGIATLMRLLAPRHHPLAAPAATPPLLLPAPSGTADTAAAPSAAPSVAAAVWLPAALREPRVGALRCLAGGCASTHTHCAHTHVGVLAGWCASLHIQASTHPYKHTHARAHVGVLHYLAGAHVALQADWMCDADLMGQLRFERAPICETRETNFMCERVQTTACMLCSTTRPGQHPAFPPAPTAAARALMPRRGRRAANCVRHARRSGGHGRRRRRFGCGIQAPPISRCIWPGAQQRRVCRK